MASVSPLRSLGRVSMRRKRAIQHDIPCIGPSFRRATVQARSGLPASEIPASCQPLLVPRLSRSYHRSSDKMPQNATRTSLRSPLPRSVTRLSEADGGPTQGSEKQAATLLVNAADMPITLWDFSGANSSSESVARPPFEKHPGHLSPGSKKRFAHDTLSLYDLSKDEKRSDQ